jgi:hypothetical protein
LYRHDESNNSTKAGPLSLLLFTSVSTVCRVHPSLVSLGTPFQKRIKKRIKTFSVSLANVININWTNLSGVV